MATERPPKKRPQRSTQLSRQTRGAQELAELVLNQIHIEGGPLASLAQQDGVEPLLTQLRQDLAVLADAPKLRIGAARRIQGASARRQTMAQQLFAVCAEIRRRVKVRFRGPRHADLRHAFGEGMAANPSKPETVLSLAERICTAAQESSHAEALRTVRIGPPTVQRLTRMLASLREGRPERQDLQGERRRIVGELSTVLSLIHI